MLLSLTKTARCLKAISIYGFLVLGMLWSFGAVQAQTIEDRRAELRRTLETLNAEIEDINEKIGESKQQATGLQKEINLLKSEARKIELEIKQIELAIADTVLEIEEKNEEIKTIEQKLDSEKSTLAEFMRLIHEKDQASLFEIVLLKKKFSDFFDEVNAIENLHLKVKDFFEQIRNLKRSAEEERQDLEEQRRQHERLKSIQGIKKNDLLNKRQARERLFVQTKGRESEYKNLVTAKQKNAAEIRSRLFLLAGSAAIPFEKAFEYANLVSQKTNIRPAFLLGVFKVESELGANVGRGNWQEDLAHPRCAAQRVAFKQVTAELGLNPDLMPVSRRVSYGYCGGAMGPAQFMPTTWLLYKSSIAALTGHNPPNPWEPLDAFMASALLLKDNGGVGGLSNERTAALRYLAGSRWQKPAYQFYGNEVLAYAQEYQEQIDILQSVASR